MSALPQPASPALRLARRAWALLLTDTAQARKLAERALAAAGQTGDLPARARAHITLGFHWQYYGTLAEAAEALRTAATLFDQLGDPAGRLLATVGLGRTLWRGGQFQAAMDLLLPLRDEGIRLLRHQDRAVLLNAIAGCFSSLGQSEQAIAYMHQALHDAGPRRGQGFDAVLHCNLANELTQLGDVEQALRHANQGLSRCESTRNPFLRCALLINRIIVLTDLGRAAEALPDIAEVMAWPTDASGRGGNAPHHPTLAMAALKAGDSDLGARLVALALQHPGAALPDDRLELALAQALLAGLQGRPAQAWGHLAAVRPMVSSGTAEGLSLRLQCQYFQQASTLAAQAGDAEQALSDLRAWQALHHRQDQQAHRAHYQSAALQSEMLRLTHRLQDSQAKRLATERSRAQLAAINAQLAHKMAEVQALQQALRQQATSDVLTGLHNRRYLNEVLPAQWAMAQRAGTPLAVVLIDLDHFKTINDTLGHPAGDQVLAAFGQLLASSLRKTDLACRYGGEEFCLLLPRSTAAAALRKVQALQKRWSQATPLPGATLGGLSFSAGLTDSLSQTGPAERLLSAADRALLAAKRAGRNRALVAGGQLARAA